VIGGRLSAFGSNARLGRGQYMVAEADESDRSFLLLWPSIAVMTNVDDEHTESYGSLEQMQAAFAEFANRVPFYGRVVACADDPGLAMVLPRIRRRLVTYGLDPGADFVGADVSLGTFGGRCTVHCRRNASMEPLGTLELAAPGRHNLQNALATVAVTTGIGVEFGRAAEALRGFLGAERRFERHGEADGVVVLDDYGHHPTEITAVLAAARVTLARRLVVAFQPHRYTRTARLMQEFGASLRDADEIVLTDIYPAGEPPIQGVTIEAFAEVVRQRSERPVRLAKRLDEVVPALLSIVGPGDAVITLGAGSIGSLPQRLVDALREREAKRR
jgi:UDP-N-acetylmuramate--alanine ligase